MSGRVLRWPSPEVWRLLDDLAAIARLVFEALARGDADLLADCRRWHEHRRAALEAVQRQTRGDEGAT